ncbi:E3 ubiquitin-protein ligase Siah1-like [Centruroides sculpturatus]|uniref:E3 ubiquitin-protein ligase Siah1-like n=1 Tax=Centruroides sculpturatus TaxID=218467 RepID=UPI000C6D87F3|nr:E3 ubiquitin-protein ligase Siah1-like [Centruroides sculpturatus]
MEEDQAGTSAEQASTGESLPEPALMALFECPVCYDYMTPPTFQCPEGHTICSRCKTQVRQCPVCRGELRNFRNLTLEKLAEIIALPCIYKENGCPEKRLLKDRKVHELHCSFRTCSCPSLDEACDWEGVYQQIIPHLTENHSYIHCLNHDSVRMSIIGIDVALPLTWITCLHCYRRDFIIQVIKMETIDENSPLLIIVQNVGNRKDSGRFRGRIEVRGRGKVIQWESIPRSVTGDLKFIIRMRDCMTLSIRMLERMLENHVLTVVVTIIPVRNRGAVEEPEPDTED